MTRNPPKKMSSTQIVLEACRDLDDMNQPVTREALVIATGLSLYIVDERLRILTSEGQLQRLKRGEYKPAPVFHEPRAISKTILPNGIVKYEIGDQIFELSPHEDRVLADLNGGSLVKLVGIEGNRQAGEVHSMLLNRMDVLERSWNDQARRSPNPRRQPRPPEAGQPA